MHWEEQSKNDKSGTDTSNVENNFFDEADYTVNKYIENIQLNWKLEAKNSKFIYKHRNKLSQQRE